MNDNLLFYDIEVFKYDSLVVFKDINNNLVNSFWSNPENGEFKEDSPNGFEAINDLIRDKTLIGFNNYHYDDLILYRMLTGRPQSAIKELNDAIIGGDNVTSEDKLAHTKLSNLNVKVLDAMQQIDVSKPGLKKIEGNMGRSIIESDIPFDIDRPLTEEEKEIVHKYCCYDVESTIEVYKLRKESYFDNKDNLVEMLGNPNAYKWNTTTISANILLSRPETLWAKPKVPEDKWRHIKDLPNEVWDMWEKVSYQTLDEKNESITINKYDCDIVFGMGGLHGCNNLRKSFTDVKLLDVASMYPSIISNLNALGKGTEKYKELKDERIRIKKSDPVKAKTLKLILNSVYGNLKNEHSILYNPMAAVTVCIYGQMALFDLCRRLYEVGYTLININTDGVAFKDGSNKWNAYIDVWYSWCEDFKLELECDEFDYWIQKDVNNYVAKTGEHIKTKGGECNKYADNNFFSNNDARIVQIGLVDKLMFNKSPLDTILENLNNPLLFQYVLKAGGTFKGTYDEAGNKLQNVNRIFAANEGIEGTTKLYKVRHDGGRVNFPDVPYNMYLYNGDLKDFTNFKDIVDIGFYYNLINKKLEGWSMNG